MATPQGTVCDFGWRAPDFDLLGVDGKRHTLASARGPAGLVVMFICNHCPYVKAVREKLVRDMGELRQYGIGSIAISANDVADYPEDSFDNMAKVAREFNFPFPYVYDESQTTAKAYGALCTPEFFGFNADLALQYHGRLDASAKASDPNAARELFNAMVQIARTGQGPREQVPGMGCSIKWKP